MNNDYSLYPDLYFSLINVFWVIIPALITGFLGYLYGLLKLRKEQQLKFNERQLREFYSPILGCVEEIKAKTNVRKEIFKLSDPAWKKIVAEHPHPFLESDKYFEPFEKQILYENNQFRYELFTLYKKMFGVFSANISLAKSPTRKWYYELARFVEIWERWLADSIPIEVIKELDHNEKRLEPFYQDLKMDMENLRKKISGKKT